MYTNFYNIKVISSFVKSTLKVIITCYFINNTGILLAANFSNSIKTYAPQSDTKELLKLFEHNAQSSNYKGTLVVQKQKNNNIETKTFNVIHFYDGQSEYEKIVPLEGKMLSVVRINQISQTYLADSKIIITKKKTDNSFPVITNDIENIDKYYLISSIEKERFLGQPVNVINLLSKDKDRFNYKIWVSNNFILKLQTIFNGKILGQIFFSDLNHIELDKNQIQNWMEMGKNWVYKLPRMHEVDIEHKEIAFLNQYKGYKYIKSFQRINKENEHSLYQAVYSDGLGQISIFVEKSPNQFFNYFSRKSLNNISSRYLDGYNITALGDAPPHVIKSLLETIKLKSLER